MSPSSPRPIYSEADMVISTFSFYPNLEPRPQNLYRGEASGPPRSVSGMTQESTETRVKSSGMPHEGSTDPVTNDGPRFYSNVPVNKLTEHVT